MALAARPVALKVVSLSSFGMTNFVNNRVAKRYYAYLHRDGQLWSERNIRVRPVASAT
jgi:hypothetical protein